MEATEVRVLPFVSGASMLQELIEWWKGERDVQAPEKAPASWVWGCFVKRVFMNIQSGFHSMIDPVQAEALLTASPLLLKTPIPPAWKKVGVNSPAPPSQAPHDALAPQFVSTLPSSPSYDYFMRSN